MRKIGSGGHTNKSEDVWKYILKTSNENDCWIWTRYCNKKGYGCFTINKKKKLAHKFIYELIYGKVPEEMQVMHSCDNPPCCNPKHLLLGTNQDNQLDARKKLRNSKTVKLTKEQIKQIKQLRGIRTQQVIAQMFNITQANVSCIQLNKSWKWLEV